MYIHIHILSDIVQRFKVKKIHVDLLFVPVDIKDHFSFQISQKMKLSNDPGKVESNFFCYAAIRITYLIGSALSGLFRVNWNLEILVFKERGKPEYPEKNLSEQGREPTTNNKLAMCFPAHKNVLIFTQRMHKPTERPFV